MTPRIRLATVADLTAINDIYNYYVPRSSCTFQLEPETMEARRAWFEAHGDRHPIVVAEEAGEVLGWACLTRYRSRAAYGNTVEESVYIRHDHHRRGLGRVLLSDVVQRAAALGYHSILAGISGDQPASIALHERLGFVKCAHLREVGYKFDRWIDVIWMQRMLEDAAMRATSDER